MQVVQLVSKNKRQVKEFLRLPFRLYHDTPQWVPPLRGEARMVFDRNKHPLYRHGEAAFFLAVEGDQAAGRLAVIQNDQYIHHNQDKAAFFYLFECENKPKVAQALFEMGFKWARQQGMERIMGPRGFMVFDGLGMLVKGFEHRPAFGLPYNLPYYADLVESAGFSQYWELVSGYLDEEMVFPEKVFRAAEIVKKRRGLTVTNYRSRWEVESLIPRLKDLYNTAFSNRQGIYPITDEDFHLLARQMLWFMDPRLIKIVMKDDQPVGFMLAYPDVSAAIQKCRGELLPFGWLWLLIELKRTKWININGAGMIDGYRGLGGTSILFSEMYKSVAESRYRKADLVQIGTDNEAMLREMEGYGIKFYKTHRLYQKEL